MATPEGRVKQRVKKLLDKYENVYYSMPVPYGYGKSELDFVVCVNGRFLEIETKAGKGNMTVRQRNTADQIEKANGTALLVNETEAAWQALIEYLETYTRRKP